MSPSHSTRLTEKIITRRLESWLNDRIDCPYPPGMINPTLRPAAILIPMLYTESKWHLLFIRRAAHENDPHSGQVAFPGGASDPADDSPITTALRETQEEIGINPRDVRILGKLNQSVTITSYLVTPIIGIIPWPYSLTLAPNEVSRSFTIPLDWLSNPINHITQSRILPYPYTPIPVTYFDTYDGEVLWGASAKFTLELIEALYGNPGDRTSPSDRQPISY